MKSSSTAGRRRLAIAVALLAVGLLAGSAAIAASGSSGPRPSFTISGGVNGLYPGAHSRAELRITNHRHWTIDVRRIFVTVASTSNPGCPRSMVRSPGWAGSVRVAKGKTRAVSVPISMRAAAPDACQGAVFALRYSGWAVRQ